jgi:hypothetical protein
MITKLFETKIKYDTVVINNKLSHCGGCCGAVNGRFSVGLWTEAPLKCKHDRCIKMFIKAIDERSFEVLAVIGEKRIYGFACAREGKKPVFDLEGLHEPPTEIEREDKDIKDILNSKYEIDLVL